MRTFASDNAAPAAAEILRALEQANQGDAVSYGHDDHTLLAQQCFQEIFGSPTQTFFVFNGTGANVVALSAILDRHEAVLTPASSHLQTDECGAFERFTGCKVIPIETIDGKLRPRDLERFAGPPGDEHHVRPRAISVSQSTEYGTLYQPHELQDLCSFAHEQGWVVHLDGARIANAAAALQIGLREATRDLGVDVLSFGGTKNGLLYGEAIVFFDPALHRDTLPFARKQGMQLPSKMRFIAAQFLALLKDERWRTHAQHANAMARRLEERVRSIPGVRITRPVECNAIFATVDRSAISALQKRYFFYVFDERLPEVRWMTHHATSEQDVDDFAAAIAQIASTGPR